MATVLQTDLLVFLTPLFIFLLVWVVLYSLLQKFKFFGGIKGFDALISVAVSILFLFSPEATSVVSDFTPWVMLLGMLVLVIFIFFMALGVKEGVIVDNILKSTAFITVAVVIIVVLFLIALTNVFGPFLLSNSDPGFWNATKRAILNPRMLGALFLLVIASYTVRFVATNQ